MINRGAAGILTLTQILPLTLILPRCEGRSVAEIMKEIFAKGPGQGLHRLWFGAATRSVRTGCASVLYFQARLVADALWPA